MHCHCHDLAIKMNIYFTYKRKTLESIIYTFQNEPV